MSFIGKSLGALAATAVVASGLAVAAPASAEVVTFADFTAVNSTRNVRWVEQQPGAGGLLYTTATGSATSAGSVEVKFNFKQPGISNIFDNVRAIFTLNASTTGDPATFDGTTIKQVIDSGTFSFILKDDLIINGVTYGTSGQNLLSGTFTKAVLSGSNLGTAAGIGASNQGANAGLITYTSDFLMFDSNSNFDLGFVLTSVNPVLARGGTTAGDPDGNPTRSVRTFRANMGGQFSSDPEPIPLVSVPEPATWAMMIGGFGLLGASLRRRRALVEA